MNHKKLAGIWEFYIVGVTMIPGENGNLLLSAIHTGIEPQC